MTEPDTIDIDDHLHLGTGITADERTIVVSTLDPISERLKSLDRGSLKIEAWIKNRDERGQVVYVSINAADTDIVAHDDSADITDALVQIRQDLRRQLNDLHDRRTNRRH
jgi:ribosome-associated translation inhibitor RaiA